MSDAHNEHESAIRTPKQLIAAIIASFVVPIIAIILLVKYVASDNQVGAGSTSQTAEAIAARIKPVSDEGFTFKDVNAPRTFLAAAEVYKQTCAACHATGAVGAPKVGDAAGWAPRIAQGFDTLVGHAIKGIRAMPAKGGNGDLDDFEVASAVVYMANQSGGKLKEPTPPAPAAAAPAAGAAAAGAAPAASAPADANVTNAAQASPAPAAK